MSFFARPDLSNEQFKQLSGSTLTLSGQTRIASTGNLSFQSGNTYIPIVITGGTNYDVLTLVSGQLRLQAPSSGASTGYYVGRTPSTVCVGGIPISEKLTGRTIADILQEMLAPLANPSVSPSNAPVITSFTITPSTSIYEVGTCLCGSNCICVCTIFSQGAISPIYCGGASFRSGLPKAHIYRPYGVSIPYSAFTASLSNCYKIPASCLPSGITLGNNTISACVAYSAGTTILNSSGGTASNFTPNPLSASATTTCSITICGLYPWFWGCSVSAPTINQILINGYTCKCVACSMGNILVDNFNVSGKYIWFAIPYTSTSKTSWQGCNNPSNNGVIPGGLFPVACCMNIVSPESCWGTICYKIYVSNYATSVNYGMAFSN